MLLCDVSGRNPSLTEGIIFMIRKMPGDMCLQKITFWTAFILFITKQCRKASIKYNMSCRKIKKCLKKATKKLQDIVEMAAKFKTNYYMLYCIFCQLTVILFGCQYIHWNMSAIHNISLILSIFLFPNSQIFPSNWQNTLYIVW